MKKTGLIIGFILSIIFTAVEASTPVWTFTPLTATTLTVSENGSASIKYQVENQSLKPKVLEMLPIRGVTANTPCSLAPEGQAGSTCLLQLDIDGSALPSQGIQGGPVLCETNANGTPNPNQCYQPGQADSLNIQKQGSTFTVGGNINGLLGTLELQNNGMDTISTLADGIFTFPTALSPGDTYNVTVLNAPMNQTCTVSNGQGTIVDANITNVQVQCSENSYTVGGTASGLTGTVILQNNGGDNLPVSANGSFTFPTPVAQGSNYLVTILTQPDSQTCTVINGSGSVGAGNVTSVQVICSTNAYTVGGTINGLNGTLVLRNNTNDLLIRINDGSFTFLRPVADGALYNVKVVKHPAAQTCTINNGTGVISGANVSNVDVNCLTNTTALQASVSDLALSVTGLTNGPSGNNVSSGTARIITINNIGTSTATNLSITYPTWPSGTSAATTCGASLGAGNACTITITPGNTATLDGTSPCSVGTAPLPGAVQVVADNASEVSTDVVVLSYDCVYKGGYIFSIDDVTPPNTTSIIGKVAATSDAGSSQWSGQAGVSVGGIADNSVAGPNSCDGKSDGQCNTTRIINANPFPPVAASLCANLESGSYTDWFFPAICEMGYSGTSLCGTQAVPFLQNIYSNLKERGVGNLNNSAYYWSSTEVSSSPGAEAWSIFMGSGSEQGENKAFNSRAVRCARKF
jgi:hypothetical protein